MKCRVCGYEVEEGASHCPMCGTRVLSASADKEFGEISWNTKDFPKPKEMEDIEMSWPALNSFTRQIPVSEEKIEEALDKKEPLTVMSEDASEGYVSRPTPAEEKPAERSYVPPMSVATMEVRTSNVPPEARSKDEPPLPEYWYAQKFTATGIMKTGPAWPMAPGSTKPGYPTTATIESMTLSDPVPLMSAGNDESEGPGFTLEDILEEYSEPSKTPAEPAAVHTFANVKAPEPVPAAPAVPIDTLRQKNEEFQKLLDREYDRLRVLHGNDEPEDLERSIHFVPDEKVQAKDLSTFEKMLMQAEGAPAEKTPAQKFFTEPTEDEKETSDPELAAFIAPSGDPSEYDIDKIESTIKELQEQDNLAEQRRTERQKRLDTMAAAREAYYANLDKKLAEAENAAEKTAEEPEKAAAEEIVQPAAEAAAEAGIRITEPAEEYVEDASPVDLWDDEEPTKEIPVGSILKALAAGGTLAAVEKSMEIESVQDAAQTAEVPAVKVAAMSAAPLASISEDLGWTKVFKRSLTEEAEERAKSYEEKTEAPESAAVGADAAEEIAKKYESIFGHPAKQEEEEQERKSWTIEDPSVFAGIREEALKKPAEAAEAASEAAEATEAAEETAEEAAAETAEEAAAIADSIDEKLAEAEKALEEKLAEADAALGRTESEDTAGQTAETAEQTAETAAEGPAEAPELGADVEDAQARIAAAIAAAAAAGQQAESAGEEAAQAQPAEGEEVESPESENGAQPAEGSEDPIAAALAGSGDVSEPTHEFDLEEAKTEEEKKEEEKTEESEDDEEDEPETKSRHVFLKIVGIVLLICAVFEGAVFGLKQFAPESQITENAVQIEQGVRDAFVSLYNTVYDAVSGLFGGN